MANKTSLLTADYFAKLVGGEIGKFILQQQLAILELEKKTLELDQNLRDKPRAEPRGSGEQALPACDATSVQASRPVRPAMLLRVPEVN